MPLEKKAANENAVKTARKIKIVFLTNFLFVKFVLVK